MGDSHPPTVKILTLFLLITSFLGVGTRALTKGIIFRAFSLDDYLISVSLLFATGQSIAVFVQARQGYGSPSVPLSQSQMVINLKSEYVAGLLYIASLCFAKTSVLALVKTITPVRIDQKVAYGLLGFVFLWAITGEFATAFICHLPRPWDYLKGHCYNNTIRHRWWNYFEITNIITDLALMLFPFVIIWKIQIPKSKKASVFSFFALRSTVIAASASKLHFWNQAQRSSELGLDPWTVTICTQVIQCLSIVSACFLYLKPFLDSVESGFIRSDDIRRRGTSDYYGHTNGGSSSTRSAFSIRKPGPRGSKAIGLKNITSGRNATTITAGEPVDNGEAESQHSQSHFIKQTRTFAVEDSTNDPKVYDQRFR